MGIPLPPTPPPGPEPKYASRLHTGKVSKAKSTKPRGKNRRKS